MTFDSWPWGHDLMEPYQNTVEDVCKTEFMVRFDRPLFWSRYEAGDRDVRKGIVSFARKKLAGSEGDALTNHSQLAVLMFRIGLSLHKTRREVHEQEVHLVKAHMITAYTIPDHREYIHVGASSEPILAEAAAQLMDINNTWDTLLYKLFRLHNRKILNVEQGKLLARLLLTKAHDWAVRSKAEYVIRPRWFTKSIPLADFLESLVGKENKNKIMDAKPDNMPDGPTLATNGLGQAILNFTHWAKAEGDCSLTDDGAWIALTRCMAWQCCDEGPQVDIVTPLMLPMEGAKLGPCAVSAIFWQIKTRSPPDHISPEAVNSRPYLTIVLDFTGSDSNPDKLKPVVSISSSKLIPGRNSLHETTHPRYAVSISGCTHEAFPELIAAEEEHKYSSLLKPRNCTTDHGRQDLDSLEIITQQKPLWGSADGELPSSFSQCGTGPSRLYCPRTN
ncbi:hypothetical protein RhiLY_11302 [Ceratobasidium sp. AG-Ba]|nr:hypothetical protein RhiLY_11302 [Ceratobasidium sp. AG-Ba]